MGWLDRLRNWLVGHAAQPAGPPLPVLKPIDLVAAQRAFHAQRERIEARFFSLASASGRPRHLRWTRCDFEDAVTYARDRTSGQLQALVAVTIGFEAVEGGLMEDVEAVKNLRAATAAFRYDGANWTTDGRAIFNLSPAQTIEYYQQTLVAVGQEPAA